jgi:dihydrofolate reductase
VDRIYLTEVDLEPEGDAGFPDLSPEEWREVSAETVEAAKGDDAGFTLRVLDRVRAS